MMAIAGIYENGQAKLDYEISSLKPLKVIVTFLEDVEITSGRILTLSDFSFSKSQELLKDYSGSFSDDLIQERRKD